MAKPLYYYTGPGVLHFEGKDYGFGALLPAAVPDESIVAMLKKGKVSTTMPDKGGAPVVADGQLDALKEKLKSMEAAAADGMAEIEQLRADLAAVTGERDAARDSVTDLAAKLEQANTTIEELTKQITNPGAAPSGAGPKK